MGIMSLLLAGILVYYVACLDKNVSNTVKILISCILLVCGIVVIPRYIGQGNIRSRQKVMLSFITFFGVPLLMVGLLWNYTLTWTNILTYVQNAILIYIFQGVLFVIIFRIKPVMFVSIFVNWFFFLADEVVLVLRKTPLVPTDILSINTAMSVAGNYKFQLTARLILATVFSIIIAYAIYKLPLEKNMIGEQKISELIGYRIAVAAFTAILVIYVSGFQRDTFQKDNFDVENMNENVGIPLTFYLNSKEMVLQEPDGYGTSKAKAYLSEYQDETDSSVTASAGQSQENPNVIIIMDEAFSDLSILGDLELNTDPLKFCHSLEEDPDTISGKLNVSVWGGNTCNTEFEVLTGNTLEMLPYGSIPYMQYITENTDSICDYFHKLGYTNIAIHPYWGQCWRRDTVYNQIGFDKFIDAEDFDQESSTRNLKNITIHSGYDFGDLDYVREYISDKESFQQIIHQFESKDAGEKLFLFNVTMQNHGGYLYDGDNFEYTVRSARYPAQTVSQYLSLVQKTDEALEYLISYFKEVSEPTVILFFGDHQPGLVSEFYETMFGHSYENFTISDYQKRYTVPYYIWANYDLNDVKYDQVSANYLSMVLKEAAGLPMDSWDNFRKSVYEEYPVLTSRLIMDKSGIRFNRGTVSDELLDKYAIIQYYKMKE